jgi:vanillate O-demethylase ferredoxin subunit
MSDWIDVTVARRHEEATDIASFDLVSSDGSALPAFAPGAHIDVQVGDAVRQYSLCNPAGQTQRYQIAVLRDPRSRGGSAALHAQVHAGSRLRISAPRNHFALNLDAPHTVLLAGGIGITPLMCMAELLSRQGRPFTLHCCARTRDRLAFADTLVGSAFGAQVRLHLDDGPAAQLLDITSSLTECAADTQLYVCGPQGFIAAVLDAARALGWSPARLHWEHFGAAPAASATNAADDGFTVTLARSQRRVAVPAGVSIAHALQAAGVPVTLSCEQGVCGTCLTRVLEGQPEHRDLYLTPEEQAGNQQMLICCSRARTPELLLDL